MNLVTVVGARPQFIKAATVSRAIGRHNSTAEPDAHIREIMVHTGQHYDRNMSRIFFDELEIPEPAYNLGVGSGRQGQQTASMMTAIESVLLEERPDLVLVYGDTNSTLAGALAAVKLHIPSVHVEAGLRSGNRRMPEEINRLLADHVASLLMCPTSAAVDNLRGEGIGCHRGTGEPIDVNVQRIYRVGDVMYDSVLHACASMTGERDWLDRRGLKPKTYALVTLHRAENVDDRSRLERILRNLAELARSDMDVLLPLHPRTHRRIVEAGLENVAADIRMCEPVGYKEMLHLARNAQMVATDSGGLQKEAFFLETPCLTFRDETEWVETVRLGWNTLVGVDSGRFQSAYARIRQTRGGVAPFLDSAEASSAETLASLPFGDGRAAERIVEVLARVAADIKRIP